MDAAASVKRSRNEACSASQHAPSAQCVTEGMAARIGEGLKLKGDADKRPAGKVPAPVSPPAGPSSAISSSPVMFGGEPLAQLMEVRGAVLFLSCLKRGSPVPS